MDTTLPQKTNDKQEDETMNQKAVLTPYLLEDSEQHDSVLIIPGGGYNHIAQPKEGELIAAAVNREQMNAFVLVYRVGPYYWKDILPDAIEAVKSVQFQRRNGSIGKKLAVMGFSAGGHLTLMEAENAAEEISGDEVSKETGKPDALILCYPVVTFTEPFVHKGSRNYFLGIPKNAEDNGFYSKEEYEKLIDKFSAEKHIGPDFPPTFIWHCEKDPTVPVENSIMLKDALETAGVHHKLIIFPEGDHGMGLAQDDETIRTWFPECIKFLHELGFH